VGGPGFGTDGATSAARVTCSPKGEESGDVSVRAVDTRGTNSATGVALLLAARRLLPEYVATMA
jgi:hypothetical protein